MNQNLEFKTIPNSPRKKERSASLLFKTGGITGKTSDKKEDFPVTATTMATNNNTNQRKTKRRTTTTLQSNAGSATKQYTTINFLH